MLKLIDRIRLLFAAKKPEQLKAKYAKADAKWSRALAKANGTYNKQTEKADKAVTLAIVAVNNKLGKTIDVYQRDLDIAAQMERTASSIRTEAVQRYQENTQQHENALSDLAAIKHTR